MPVLYIRIFFFCLMPIGSFILYHGIKILRKAFNGKVMLEMPYLQQTGEFTILKRGIYSIWQKGEMFRKTPLDQFSTHIYEKATQQEINLSNSLMSPRSNDFSTGRMEIYTFSATPSIYELRLQDGSSVLSVQIFISKLVPLPSVDLSKYFIQVRESQSQLFTLLGIPIVLVGAFGVIGGFVLGLLADQVFK
ncbi:hypothetical protein EZJ43_13430 [Pedobacter changchengzhani]|uniref:Uncharacterized protein n=2 Tax=Pedobacter changchengzhani TaxID=2529274 RepID=A0A4R5MKC2_9SPHI|nr:hypothetical protein EZJ43_13430 [Pedobacter changchengzhani]